MTDLPRRRPWDNAEASADWQQRARLTRWFHPEPALQRRLPERAVVPDASTGQIRAGDSGADIPGSAPVPVGRPAVEQRVLTQLRWLRNEVPGIDGSIVSTSDGLLVTHDMLDLEPAQVAALIATTLSIARQAASMTRRGEFREAVVHGSTGYLAVFAIRTEAILAVLGAQNLNVGMLHYQTREAVRRLEKDVDGFVRFAGAEELQAARQETS